VNEVSQALLYGRGVFTTVMISNGQTFLWEKHWHRITNAAGRLGMSIDSFTGDDVKAAVTDAIAHDDVTDGRVRITFYDNRPSELWPNYDPNDEATSLSIIVCERRSVPRPFRCFVSPYTLHSRSPVAGVKSCNYLENILAIEDAKRRDFHEGIRLNERGHIAGACMANVFWLKDGHLYTPSLSTGCLPGTTREFVLENVECEEVEAEIGELENIDAVLLTSAGLGIVAVTELNGRRFPPIDHPILRLVT
jgi:branched-chain amino acid aminotransferase